MPDVVTPIELPPHAYVPGQTPRHPEDWFDGIKATVHGGLRPDQLHQTQAFQAGLRYLEAGYFWECHEVLEAVWMHTPQGSVERDMVQALIQLANARLKAVMARPRAVLRLCDMVEGHLEGLPPQLSILGVLPADIKGQVGALRALWAA